MQLSMEEAETIGLKVLTWLMGNDELVQVFMGSTGIGAEDLRLRAGDSDFLGSVLDFLTMDDAWVMQFCDSQGMKYELPLTAKMILQGKSQMHWT
ncbi:hypothetical protein RSK20926_02714 [Roseobacter sp. SK209-2-6]|uniref:DUF3572 domain-containing protein n=1 Tax=Roseobacter sp. SK209-2-6 TaxID=388739 RepID=UPI0000F3ED18|nr:DUF3572 domain-containing protein [Roseobacter sp. SK209-2-6]EBA16681.1 hypothetical protein RSK20926_02714 [Roseobacter sp. SK209-2-6]